MIPLVLAIGDQIVEAYSLVFMSFCDSTIDTSLKAIITISTIITYINNLLILHTWIFAFFKFMFVM